MTDQHQAMPKTVWEITFKLSNMTTDHPNYHAGLFNKVRGRVDYHCEFELEDGVSLYFR